MKILCERRAIAFPLECRSQHAGREDSSEKRSDQGRSRESAFFASFSFSAFGYDDTTSS